MKKVNIGVAGLGFGKEFAAIYCDHPLVDKVAICTRNPETLNKVGEELGIPEELRFTNYDDMISHEELDAIHIVTPIKEHYPQLGDIQCINTKDCMYSSDGDIFG